MEIIHAEAVSFEYLKVIRMRRNEVHIFSDRLEYHYDVDISFLKNHDDKTLGFSEEVTQRLMSTSYTRMSIVTVELRLMEEPVMWSINMNTSGKEGIQLWQKDYEKARIAYNKLHYWKFGVLPGKES